MAKRVIALNEIAHPEHRRDGWRLCLQWARYQYDYRTEPQTGYRFIWRRPDGSLQPARGQARLPSMADAELLIRLARELGWVIAMPVISVTFSLPALYVTGTGYY